MAVNNSRNMRAELEQGIVESSFIQLQPNWSLNANCPTDRLSWPTYAQALRHGEIAVEERGPISQREGAPSGGMYHSKDVASGGFSSALNAS